MRDSPPYTCLYASPPPCATALFHKNETEFRLSEVSRAREAEEKVLVISGEVTTEETDEEEPVPKIPPPMKAELFRKVDEVMVILSFQ